MLDKVVVDIKRSLILPDDTSFNSFKKHVERHVRPLVGDTSIKYSDLMQVQAKVAGSEMTSGGLDIINQEDWKKVSNALWKRKDHSGKLAIAYQKPQALDPPPSQSPPTTSNRSPGRRRVARDDLEDEAEVIENELMAMHQPCRLSWCNNRHENKGLHCAVQPNSTHKGIHRHQFALWAGMNARGQHESKITPPVEFTDVGPSSLRGINAHRARDDTSGDRWTLDCHLLMYSMAIRPIPPV